MARKNLGDVLHYFISEEEQREARDAAAAREHSAQVQDAREREAPVQGRAPRYCLPADPGRPLVCALALELASGMAAESGDASVFCSFAASPLLPRVPGVRWEACDDLAAALAAVARREPAIAVERPARLGALLARIPPGDLDGVVLPVEAAPWGLGKALGLVRELASAFGSRRVLGLVVGAADHAAAAQLIARLSAAARRQHGVEIELLGELARDAESYRSLLARRIAARARGRERDRAELARGVSAAQSATARRLMARTAPVAGLAAQRVGRETGWSLLSRGDRVRGRTLVPASAGRHPVILLAAPDGCASSEFCASAAAIWCARAALVVFDLPLCGSRRSDKLTALALDATLPIAQRLRPDVEAQVAADFAAVLALIETDPELDPARVTFVGVGLGGELARAFLERPGTIAHVVLTKEDAPATRWLREVLDRV